MIPEWSETGVGFGERDSPDLTPFQWFLTSPIRVRLVGKQEVIYRTEPLENPTFRFARRPPRMNGVGRTIGSRRILAVLAID